MREGNFFIQRVTLSQSLINIFRGIQPEEG
ncbi:Uncharacterised protein [Klebsiella pneumoniae]|nr:Uncharacterised protein [Klebsiella pneumoniae]